MAESKHDTPSMMGREKIEPRALSEWHEDMGSVVWWCWREGGWLGEPAYIGTPLDLGQTVEVTLAAFGVDKLMRAHVGGWPGYHTHWTSHPDFPNPPHGGPKP